MKIGYQVKALFVTIFIFAFSLGFSQDMKAYSELTSKGDSLYKKRNYSDAVKAYQNAFKTLNDQGKVKDRYAAATCWALLDNKDSAFAQLTRIVTKGKYAAYFQITEDENLRNLHKDPRWEQLLRNIKENVYIKSAELNNTIQPAQGN